MALFKDYTTICNSAPSEFLATLALRNRQTILSRNLNIIKETLKFLNAFFDRYSEIFQWTQPKAGPIGFPGLLWGAVEEFCHQLVSSKGVLLLPGTLYGKKYNFIRIGFGRENIPECLEKLSEFIED